MFLENKTEKIVVGIFIGGMIYFIGFPLIYLATVSNLSSEVGYYITIGMFKVGDLCKFIGIMVIFKFLCDVLYKTLKALDKYNNE